MPAAYRKCFQVLKPRIFHRQKRFGNGYTVKIEPNSEFFIRFWIQHNTEYYRGEPVMQMEDQ
jgi:hypothetical protein